MYESTRDSDDMQIDRSVSPSPEPSSPYFIQTYLVLGKTDSTSLSGIIEEPSTAFTDSSTSFEATKSNRDSILFYPLKHPKSTLKMIARTLSIEFDESIDTSRKKLLCPLAVLLFLASFGVAPMVKFASDCMRDQVCSTLLLTGSVHRISLGGCLSKAVCNLFIF